jgi:fucose 4-O-acetylase-like acetyltransferase
MPSSAPSTAAAVTSGFVRSLLLTIPTRGATPRLFDIDAARGIAIFLVVLGHVVATDMPQGNTWYEVLKELIYRFHMPLFMTLTGISFALSLPTFASWRDVLAYSLTKAQRLIVPYLVFGFLILAGKLVASRFMHVDNVPQGTLADVLRLLVSPGASAAGFLWFIYVLAVYFMLVPALFFVMGRRPVLLLLLGVGAQAFEWPALFMLNRVAEYLPFYAGGMILWVCRARWSAISGLWAAGFWLLFIALLTVAIPWSIPKWLLGAVSVPATLALTQRAGETFSAFWAWVGQRSMSIYLMNTIAIGLTKALLLKLMPWHGISFLLFFPLLTLAGVGVPLFIKARMARWSKAVDRYL